MSINMNNKYYEMHTEVLSLCAEQGLRILPGKRAAFEILKDVYLPGIKDFMLFPGDFEKFMNICVPQLENRGYYIETEQQKTGRICRLLRQDMLGTTVPALMNNPDGRHSPQFIMRELTESNGQYRFAANGAMHSIDFVLIDKLIETGYMGSCVYVASSPQEHIENIFGMDVDNDSVSLGYFLFSTEYSQEEFLKGAKDRGYISDERLARHKEYRMWRRQNRTQNDKAYEEYRKTFMGLKLP